jgi:hypothetical protein
MGRIMSRTLIDECQEVASALRDTFDLEMTRYANAKHVHEFEGWTDWFWTSNKIRKAHLKIIEPGGKNRKQWLLHMNVFPASNIDAPIFGLDIVATPNKISGCFCDFSPTTENQKEFTDFFQDITKTFEWKRERELPPWAQEIFTPEMIAAGSIRQGPETDQLILAAGIMAEFYFNAIRGLKVDESLDTTDAQNKYCINQKMNKMLHSSILSWGISESDKDDYVNDVLFEEI